MNQKEIVSSSTQGTHYRFEGDQESRTNVLKPYEGATLLDAGFLTPLNAEGVNALVPLLTLPDIMVDGQSALDLLNSSNTFHLLINANNGSWVHPTTIEVRNGSPYAIVEGRPYQIRPNDPRVRVQNLPHALYAHAAQMDSSRRNDCQ